MLHILAHMDPASTAEIEYLWNVFYNVFWDSATKERFVDDVQRVLHSMDGTQLKDQQATSVSFGDAELGSKLRELLQWWLSIGLRKDVKTLQKTRCAFGFSLLVVTE